MKRNGFAATIVAALVVCGLTACGSSSGGSAVNAGNTPPGKPIVIGSVCSCSGPQSASLANSKSVLEAWAAYINNRGGINGHPVQITVLDDGGDAAKSLQLVKQLVEQDKVQAIVGEQSLVDVSWAKYVAQKGVPVIGAASYNTTFMTAPDFYTTGSQTPILVFGLVQQAKLAGKTKLGVMPCAEAPACAQVPGLVAAMGRLVGGVQLVYTGKVTVTQPSYTANCLAAKQAGVDGLIVVENAATVARVAAQCAQQGFKPLELNISATTGKSWAGDPNMNGTIAIEPQPPLVDESAPGTIAFHTALAKFAPSVPGSAEYNESNLWTFSAGEAFALAAERANLSPTSTPADVTRGLDTFHSQTLSGLTPPLTFGKPGPSPLVPCYFTTVVKGSAFTAPDAARPICLQADMVKALGTALSAG
jgi:branched-chain amino acid transport system substrate-binding protein